MSGDLRLTRHQQYLFLGCGTWVTVLTVSVVVFSGGLLLSMWSNVWWDLWHFLHDWFTRHLFAVRLSWSWSGELSTPMHAHASFTWTRFRLLPLDALLARTGSKLCWALLVPIAMTLLSIKLRVALISLMSFFQYSSLLAQYWLVSLYLSLMAYCHGKPLSNLINVVLSFFPDSQFVCCNHHWQFWLLCAGHVHLGITPFAHLPQALVQIRNDKDVSVQGWRSSLWDTHLLCIFPLARRELLHHHDVIDLMRRIDPPLGWGKLCPHTLAQRVSIAPSFNSTWYFHATSIMNVSFCNMAADDAAEHSHDRWRICKHCSHPVFHCRMVTSRRGQQLPWVPLR